MMPIVVKVDDVRSGTKAKACHSWLRVAWESMG